MWIKNITQPYEIFVMETNEYHSVKSRNTYFELIFVLEGTGTQAINEYSLPYSANKLFLVFPQDTHSFTVLGKSKFIFLRFNESYLKTLPKEWLLKMEYIFCNHNHLPGCILKNREDKPLVRAIMEGIYRENMLSKNNLAPVTEYLLNAIIAIAARNIALQQQALPLPSVKQQDSLLTYIHRNIKEPQRLRIECIAEEFHLSTNYVSEFFKREVGQSLRSYIMTYKMNLIMARLKFSSMRINEIAEDFGFSDSSHFDKQFKKHFGMSPSSVKSR